VFVEKYVVEPRHIEIQVLGDSTATSSTSTSASARSSAATRR
jgi:acetyl/propionyl-CoA carboxylase alpha subunit